MIHGSGIMTCSDGTVDIGTWKNAISHGNMTIIYTDGFMIKTKYVNGKELENKQEYFLNGSKIKQ